MGVLKARMCNLRHIRFHVEHRCETMDLKAPVSEN